MSAIEQTGISTLAKIPAMKTNATKWGRESQRHKVQMLLLAIILERKRRTK
jgi:hypothetical protein